MSECLIYQLKPGRTDVGRLDSDKPAIIKLSGESINEEHCYFDNNDGKVTLHAMPNAVTVCFPPSPRYMRLLTLPQFLNGRQITPGQVSVLAHDCKYLPFLKVQNSLHQHRLSSCDQASVSF